MNQGFYHRHTLSNGIRVLCEEVPYVRSVSIGVWVGAGSRYELAEQAGISHLIEHLLFKGTERRSAKDIAETMDSVGGQLNAFTAKETTCYYARVLDQHLNLAVDLLSDMVFHSVIDPNELDKEKGVIIEEIKMYEDAPDELVHDLFAQAIWPQHPLGRSIVGTAPVIKSLTRDNIIDYFQAHYSPERIVLSAAGNLKLESLIEVLETAFGGISPVTGARRAASGEEPPVVLPSRCVRTKDIEQVHICLGNVGVPQDHEDMYPLYILNNCLGGGPSSRLFQEIRECRGLAYSVYSYLSSYKDSGVFAVYAGMSPDQTAQVVEITLDQLREIKERGLSEGEVRRSKEQMKGQLVLSMESISNRMSRLGRSELTLGRVLSPDQVIAKIDAVTPQDLARVAERILSRPLTLSAVGPQGKMPEVSGLNLTI